MGQKQTNGKGVCGWLKRTVEENVESGKGMFDYTQPAMTRHSPCPLTQGGSSR